jgi:branched-chain amino acid transport system permease protein
VSNNFYLDVAIRIGINAIIVLGLNLLIGFAGQISFGHAGFLGIGAYASAVLPTHFGWPPALALVAGAAVAAALAAVLAWPIFKLKGHYLAMATLGLGIILALIFRNEAAYTGGPDGIPVPTMELGGFAIASDRQWYWIVAALLLVSVWASLNIINSPFGRALRALHGSEVAAKVVGVDIARYKMTIFVMSAAFASIMGSVTAHYVGFVTPNIADFVHSIELVTMVVVGGMASVFGSLAFGTILVLCMIFLPRGLVPTLAAKFGKDR